MTRKEVEAKVAAGESLQGAELSGAKLSEAELSGAELSGANLYGANLFGANLFGANLFGANLFRADLSETDLSDADLSEADLRSAKLFKANLRSVRLSNANLRGAYLIKADLRDADLSEADLSEVDLSGAKLIKADLTASHLSGADLSDVDLTKASLHRADLSGAKLLEAYLGGADLRDADLSGADLRRVDLYGADLTDADLRGVDLYGADLTGIDLSETFWDDSTIWPEGFEPPRTKTSSVRSLGRKAAPLLKFRKPETPRTARDFKRTYPAEFESLKSMTGGRDFTDPVIERIRGEVETPFEWQVTEQRYKSPAQRLCQDANEVLLLNVNIEDGRYSAEERRVLNALREISKRSGHPFERKPLFTIGWVRYCPDDDNQTWLVEEVQSDVQGVRKGMSDPDFRQKLRDGGLPPEDVDLAIETLKPYADRFYEDALGLVFELSAMKDYSVEMLDYESKRGFGSPRRIYTDLPRAMGMKLSPGSKVLPELASSWKITP